MAKQYDYHVPNGFKFTVCTTLRDAKRLAREQNEGSQWFDQYERDKTQIHRVSQYRFDGRKWRQW